MNKLHNRGGNNPTGIRGDQPPGEKTKNINFRCTPAFKELVDKEAKARKMSQAEFIEAAVAAFIGSEAAT